ncbi:MAG: hypothetical protein LBF22_13175 [Deltaproteobacteria bacterium]|nr:hypothetical protein [Deltaproteobacteria bacterium]
MIEIPSLTWQNSGKIAGTSPSGSPEILTYSKGKYHSRMGLTSSKNALIFTYEV